MDLTSATFVWAPAVVAGGQAGQDPGGRAARQPVGRQGAGACRDAQGRRPTGAARGGNSLAAAAGTAADGDTVVEGLLQLIGQAKSELLIISPYFVPGPDMKQAFASALARGVRVRVLTNSLASNDAPVAHVGYARHREELLVDGRRPL